MRDLQLSDGRERVRVADGIAAGLDRGIVTTELALDSNPSRGPPDGGVVEEQRLREHLQHVDEIVMAANVGQLVREDGSPLRRNAEHGRR